MGPLLDTLIVFGILQGAGLAVVLARRPKDVLANRLLATLTAAVALFLTLGYCEQRWAFTGQPHWLAVTSPLPFLFGPLLYLYIAALTRPLSRVDPRWLLHTAPFFLDLIFMTQQFYVLSGPEKLAIARAYMAGHGGLSIDVIEVFELLQAAAYLGVSWLELRRYARKMQGYFSDLTRIDLRWLRAMVIAHATVWSVVMISIVVRKWGPSSAALLDAHGVQIGSSLVIFLTGYMSLWQPELFARAQAAANVSVPEPEPEPEPETPRPKYQRNRIDDAEAEALVDRLLSLMEAKHPYRDGALTLPALAETLGVTPHTLSQLLNVRLEKTFYAFVNSYRVAAVKAALADPAQNSRGVLEIALEAGFNSKSTLNAFFKRETGMTPTEFRSQAQGSPEAPRAA
jgi:AraC-like DNA-binding protein